MRTLLNSSKEEELILALRKLYLEYGFDVYRVPKYCDYSLYYDNNDYINNQEIIKIIHPSGHIYALQADVTLSCLSDYLKKRINGNKFYYIGNTYQSKTKGYQSIIKEKQVGIEVFALNDLNTDIEVIILGLKSLKAASSSYRLDLGEVNFIGGLLESYQLDAEVSKSVNELINSRNTSELNLLLQSIKLDQKLIDNLCNLILLYGPIEEVLIQAKSYVVNDKMQASLDYLEKINELLKQINPSSKIALNFTLNNKQNYYTGLIFQGFIRDINQPVIRGGRYEKNNIKAIGFCFNLELVINTLSKPLPNKDYLIIYDVDYVKSYQLACKLRQSNNVLLINEKMLAQYNINEFNKVIWEKEIKEGEDELCI